MDLASTYHFQGWSIRYSVLKPNPDAALQDIVFVHGTPWSSVVFRPLVQALLARGSHRVLVYDLPGYGQSQEFKSEEHDRTITTPLDALFEGDTSVRFQALALEALLGHVGMDGRQGHPAACVIAHDIAGAVVLRAHLLLGCEFESMVLCDTNAVLPWGDGFYKLARSQPQVFADLPPHIFEAVVRAVVKSARHGGPGSSQTAWEDELALPWILGVGESAGEESAKRQRSFVRQVAQANDHDVAEMLEGDMYALVRCHVKIIWGERDHWIPREKIEELMRRIGDGVKECAFIPEAGHLVMLDQPERFAVEVFACLTGQKCVGGRAL